MRTLLLSALLISGLLAAAPPVASAQALSPASSATPAWWPDAVVFRLHDGAVAARGPEHPAVARALQRLGLSGAERLFPHVSAPTPAEREHEPRVVDLTGIYRAYLPAPDPARVLRTAADLRATGLVRYAEPDFYGRPLYTPNDPQAPQQYALDRIKALDAWNTQKGDTTVVIAIVDTGVEFAHPDLAANIQHNYADPINGVDDDQDGYLDNFTGWDMVGAFFNQPAGDNNPDGGGASYHGTHVAGCASAVTDNGIGVAGPGFRCRLLPIKCAGDNNGGYIINGYAGLVYAADHGADIINCSWGILGYPDLGQDAINYATFNRNALVVTAAGNNGVLDPFSPAGFENVLTVGATDATDRKTGFSNYGVSTEVFAPGLAILSTVTGGGYANNTGTSMAAPVAAGGAGLVRAQFPAYTAEQIGQQLRMTCDNIDTANPATLAGLLGRGRINLLRAITETPSAVRFLRKRYLTGPGGAPTPLFAGASVLLTGDFRSILKPTTGLTATLTCASPLVSIAQPTVTLGTLGTGQTAVGQFGLSVGAVAPADTRVVFTITYQDAAGYQDFEKFEALLNPSFRDLTANRLHTSIGSNGRIGFIDNQAMQGLGLVYKNHDNLLWELGLLVGTDSAHVSNSIIRIASYPQVNDAHWQPLNGPVRPAPLPRADQELTGWLDDRGAGTAALPVQVRYHAQQWSAAPSDRHIFLRYTLRNPGPAPLSGLYAGLYADWDIGAGISNKTDWDGPRQLGYAYSNEPDSAYAGIQLLDPAPRGAVQATFRGIDFDAALPGNPWGISDTFTLAEKWRALSGGITRPQAGIGRGTDVCTMHGAGPYFLAPGDSVTIVFALLAADDFPDLQAAADAAAAQYQQVVGVSPETAINAEFSVYPNPSPEGRFTVLLSPAAAASGAVLTFTDALGRTIRQTPAPGERTTVELPDHPAGLYLLRLTTANGTTSRRVVVAR